MGRNGVGGFNSALPLGWGPRSPREGRSVMGKSRIPRMRPLRRRGTTIGRTPLILLLVLTMVAPTASAGDWDNPNWESQLVDSFSGLSGNTGLSAAVDSRGNTHVAYYALRGADLKYALRTGPTWSNETVDDFQVVGPDCSIALDGNDRPHICYYDKTNEELEYAHHNGTAWSIETVDWLGIVGVGTAITVGPDGDPYLAYVGARTLRCAHLEGDEWNVSMVDDGEKHVYTPSMVVDAQGVPHVLYLGAGRVKHAYLEGGEWRREEVDRLHGNTVAMRTSLRVNGDDQLVACYADDMGTSVVIARRSGGEWMEETIADNHFIGDLDMELDADGDPRVALIDMAFDGDQELVNTDVWYLEREGSSWTHGVVASSSGHQALLLDLHLDASGDPCLAILDLDPQGTEADLTHLSGWTGDFIEAYSGPPADADGGNGGYLVSIPDDPFPVVALIVVLVLAAVALAYFMQFRRARRQQGPR
jgi:hypothetical protein